jgi:hypothetical protein
LGQSPKLKPSSLLLGLALLGATMAARATQCSVHDSSLLDNSLLTQYDSGSEGCDSNPPKHEEGGSGGGWNDGDDEKDGKDGRDWKDGKDWKYGKDGKDCNPPAVPLPASSWLLASGALGLLSLGRRRRLQTV